MCRTVCMCAHRFGIAGELPCVCLSVCVYCLETDCAESTGSLCDWSCLKVGPLMNRLLSSSSGASQSLGNQHPSMCHNDRDGLWGAGRSTGCFPSEPAAAESLPHSNAWCIRSSMFVCLWWLMRLDSTEILQSACVYWMCFTVLHVFAALSLGFVWSQMEQMARTRHLGQRQGQSPVPSPSASFFHSGVALTSSWEITCHRCYHDSTIFLSVTLMCFTHLVVAGSNLPQQVRLPFTHSILIFTESKPWKLRNMWWGNVFPEHHLMLFTLCYSMTCPGRQISSYLTSFVMFCQGLQRQINVLLHLAWENMLRYIPVCQTGEFILLLIGGAELYLWNKRGDSFLTVYVYG